MPDRPRPSLPASRPSRVVVEAVAPLVDGGAFPAKATVGEPVTVLADVFTDGHDRAAAALRVPHRAQGLAGDPDGAARQRPLPATFVPDQLGRWQYQVVGWLDHLGTWRHGMELKLAAGVDVDRRPADRHRRSSTGPLDRAKRRRTPRPCAPLRDRLGRRRHPPARPAAVRGRAAPRRRPRPRPRRRRAGARRTSTSTRCSGAPASASPIAELARPVDVEVDPERARFSAWYEFFPRSTLAPATGHGTLLDALDRLDYVASMGFDVLYLPPVHPIGVTQRKGRNNTDHAGVRRHRQPVGDRGARRRAHRGAPRARHRRRRHQARRRLPRPGHRAGARHRVPVHARPPVGHRAPGVVRPPARRHDPVRREPAEEVPGHLPARLRERRLAGPVDRPGRRDPVLDRRRRHDLPRRQPAHQGVRLLGVGDRHDPPRAPRGDLPRRGVHPPAGDGAAGQDRLQPVLHVLHVAPVGVGAAPVLRGPGRAHRRLLPPQRLAQHARHPHRAAADRRAGDVRHPGHPRRHAVAGVGRLRPGVRAARAPARAAGIGGVPRLGEVPAAPVGPPPPRQPRSRCSAGSTASAASSRRWPTCARCAFHNTDNPALLCYSKTDPAGAGPPVLVVVNLDAHQRQHGLRRRRPRSRSACRTSPPTTSSTSSPTPATAGTARGTSSTSTRPSPAHIFRVESVS